VPILVRPVREQLEHDRIIRLLEAKWRRKFKVEANPGEERHAGIKVPAGTLYPDLVLTEEGGRKPKALIEVETNESVNHLEAMAQWANLAKSRTSLILFVPVGAVEAARRLSSENGIKVTELWTYHVLGDQVRFTSVFRAHGTEPADLIEKVEVFTTERQAPAPRPVPVEPEPVAPPAAEPERPRKLAVKAGSRPADVAIAKIAALNKSVAGKVAARAPEPPAAPVAAAVAKAAAPKPEAKVPARPAAPAVAVKAAPPAKPVVPVKAAAPAKAVVPAKVAAPAAPPDKKIAVAKPAAMAKPVEKPSVKPVEKLAVKPVEKLAAKPVEKLAAKPIEKAVAKKVPAKAEVKKPIVKAAPVKAAAAKPLAAKKPAPRVPPRKAAAPVRPPVRPTSAKKAAPAAAPKARPSSKRK